MAADTLLRIHVIITQLVDFIGKKSLSSIFQSHLGVHVSRNLLGWDVYQHFG